MNNTADLTALLEDLFDTIEHAELADALEERDNWLLLSDLETTAVALADVRALIRARKAPRSRRRPGARR